MRGMAKWGVLGAVLALATASGGCAGVRSAVASVRSPAEIPIRAFPRVVLVPGLGRHDREVADALALHLASTGLGDVRVEAQGAVEASGSEAPGTAIVNLYVALTATSRTEWITRPDTVCGAVGCYSTPRTTPVHTPVAEARLFVVVRDGGTGRKLQEAVLVARSSATTQTFMERSIVRDLSEQVRRAVDVRQERVRVDVLDVDHEGAALAVAHLRDGEWHEGGELFEAFLASGAAASLAPRDRARAYYDLGIARRFDDAGRADPDARFARARAAIEKAIELDPGQERYAAALAALETHREHARALREQQLALEHNRSLVQSGAHPEAHTAVSPTPAIQIPASYRR
jgi:tetratricopeptide (TPR) repeat protein